VQDARSELKAEIERSQFLASNSSRKTPAASQGRAQGTILGSDNPKNTEVIKLYEDLTNLLVPILRFSAGKYFHLNEANFTCIYTLAPRNEDEGKGKSKACHPLLPQFNHFLSTGLSFVLRFYHDKFHPDDPEPESQNELHEMVQYIPLELDKESLDFVQKLDYMGNCFNFSREQLPIFLNTIHTNLISASKSDEEDGRGQVMEVEDA
jgi:hypothetical protein